MSSKFLFERQNFQFHGSCIYSKQKKYQFQCLLLKVLKIMQYKVYKNTYKYFHAQLRLFFPVLRHQYFQYILQLIFELILSYICNLHSLNILQHHMIYHIHIHNYQDSKKILYDNCLHQSILYIHTCIYLHFNVVYYYKHLHLTYIYIYKFHAILYILFYLSLMLD